MALDHYVSQVHLRNFYSPDLGKRMYAIRKSDLKEFTPKSDDVCRIENGSTNEYLEDERAVEEFLKGVEPNYNSALEKLRTNCLDAECIYAIAGFVAYIATCSPTAMRIKSSPLKGVVEETSRILDAKGGFPPPPPELGGRGLTDLLEEGMIQVKIDPKYPQAIGIASILSHTSIFGNFKWEVLINSQEKNPFFTSDYPIAIEQTTDLRIHNKIMPLAPDIAIRICPNLDFDKKNVDFTFSDFSHKVRKPSRDEIMKINRLIVRCAEDTVFFRDNYPWVLNFVKRNAKYRINPVTRKIPHGKGTVIWCIQEISDASSD
ncbi:MAG: hypothetical protein CXR30_09155 [Geobacter sp.]|nr:MAG: hypothetical protein CXR30_09155 [Geobacter sp.]